MNHASKHTFSKVLALTFVAALALFGVFAATAAASPDYQQLCSDCHAGVGAAPTVTSAAPVGGNVTYTVNQTSTAWAAFDLSTSSVRIGGGSGSSGTFSAPVGDYVRVCSADGASTGTWSQAYFVTPKAPDHGTITPNTAELVKSGASSHLYTFTAAAGYHLSDVKVNNVSNAAAVAAGTYTFPSVTTDSTIAANFAGEVVNYTITPTAGANGSISPATPQTVAAGASITFTATPQAGYQVDTAKVDGAAVTLAAGNKYTFSNVTASHSFDVTFKVAGAQKCTATIALTGLKSGVLKLHKTVTIKGVVKPAHSGNATVTIQRKSGAKWVAAKTVARAISATTGAYSYGYKATKAGSYRVKTSVAKTAAYGAATTAYKTFKVK